MKSLLKNTGSIQLPEEGGLKLNRNVLKIIAAVSMLLDHLGYEVFPRFIILRILGRIAFPVFSWFIYEGCRYTRSRRRYFLQVFGLGLICFLVYYLYTGELFGNILLTFSLSIINIFALYYAVQSVPGQNTIKTTGRTSFEFLPVEIRFLLPVLTISATCILCGCMEIDYGFWGIMCPVFAAFADLLPLKQNRYLPLAGFTAGLVLLAVSMGGIQYYSPCTVLLLLLYNGKKGKYPMKYFFYIFYPAHLALVELIAYILQQS